MSDTTLTFTTLSSQTPVEFISDPSKPGWEDFLATSAQDERDDKDEEQDQS